MRGRYEDHADATERWLVKEWVPGSDGFSISWEPREPSGGAGIKPSSVPQIRSHNSGIAGGELA